MRRYTDGSPVVSHHRLALCFARMPEDIRELFAIALENPFGNGEGFTGYVANGRRKNLHVRAVMQEVLVHNVPRILAKRAKAEGGPSHADV